MSPSVGELVFPQLSNVGVLWFVLTLTMQPYLNNATLTTTDHDHSLTVTISLTVSRGLLMNVTPRPEKMAIHDGGLGPT